jgi:hypothetical protein
VTRWLRNTLLAASGAGFMFGLVLAVNPGHYGPAASVGGVILSIGMVAAAFRTHRAG